MEQEQFKTLIYTCIAYKSQLKMCHRFKCKIRKCRSKYLCSTKKMFLRYNTKNVIHKRKKIDFIKVT